VTGEEVRAIAAGVLAAAGQGEADLPRVAVIGLATVDLERAAAAFRERLLPGLGFEPVDDDILLGARGLVARQAGEPAIVLLEPSTEGRLAAFLARHGEGPAAVWLDGRADVAEETGAARPEAAGPFGPERLLAGSAAGPFVLVITRPASTIAA
jgi:hypothetical protein